MVIPSILLLVTYFTLTIILTDRQTSAAGMSALLAEIGRVIAVLHDGSLVHGDLTTSNILVRQPDKAVVPSCIPAAYLPGPCRGIASMQGHSTTLCCSPALWSNSRTLVQYWTSNEDKGSLDTAGCRGRVSLCF